jgi:hypothetical protein
VAGGCSSGVLGRRPPAAGRVWGVGDGVGNCWAPGSVLSAMAGLIQLIWLCSYVLLGLPGSIPLA